MQNIRKRLHDSVCLVLGKALMWMITSPFSDDHVPVEVKEKVLSDCWAHVCGGDSMLDAEQSAIYKNPLQKLVKTYKKQSSCNRVRHFCN